MAIVRMSWVGMGPTFQSWITWDDSTRLTTSVIVLNTTGVPMNYEISDAATHQVLATGVVQSQPGEQTFNIPTPQRRDIDSINARVWPA